MLRPGLVSLASSSELVLRCWFSSRASRSVWGRRPRVSIRRAPRTGPEILRKSQTPWRSEMDANPWSR